MNGGSKPWQDFQLRITEVGAISAQLDDWKQGDCIKDVPVSWLVNPGDSVTPMSISGSVPSFHSEEVIAEYAIVCSQTCDIAGEFTGGKHPYVLLAPVTPIVSITDSNLKKSALAGKTAYLFPIPQNSNFAGGDQYLVDLRSVFTVSKAFLSISKRIDGVLDESQSFQFAEFFAAKFRRVSLAEKLSDHLTDSVKAMLDGIDKAHRKKLEQIRVLITGGDRLNPNGVIIYVIHVEPLEESEMSEWEAWKTLIAPIFEKRGLLIGSLVFDDPVHMSAETYRNTVPLSRIELNGKRFW